MALQFEILKLKLARGAMILLSSDFELGPRSIAEIIEHLQMLEKNARLHRGEEIAGEDPTKGFTPIIAEFVGEAIRVGDLDLAYATLGELTERKRCKAREVQLPIVKLDPLPAKAPLKPPVAEQTSESVLVPRKAGKVPRAPRVGSSVAMTTHARIEAAQDFVEQNAKKILEAIRSGLHSRSEIVNKTGMTAHHWQSAQRYLVEKGTVNRVGLNLKSRLYLPGSEEEKVEELSNDEVEIEEKKVGEEESDDENAEETSTDDEEESDEEEGEDEEDAEEDPVDRPKVVAHRVPEPAASSSKMHFRVRDSLKQPISDAEDFTRACQIMGRSADAKDVVRIRDGVIMATKPRPREG